MSGIARTRHRIVLGASAFAAVGSIRCTIYASSTPIPGVVPQ